MEPEAFVKPKCSVDGCDKLSKAKTLCHGHYKRLTEGRIVNTPLRQEVDREGVDSKISELACGSADSPCWEWPYAKKSENGYGVIHIGGTMVGAHRYAWEKANGRAIPDGLVVRHKCDNRPCVNPAHLEIGTTQDNHNDMISRGRKPRGKDTVLAILTEEQVREVKRLRYYDGMFMRDIANQTGVSFHNVKHICLGESWAHITV